MDAWDLWTAFRERLGARGDARRAFSVLDGGYGAAGRFYHGWAHVLDCLALHGEVRGLFTKPEEAAFALWYHDVVYDPRASDNERRSALLAREAAREAGLGLPFAREAERLVLATAHGEDAPAEAGDAALVADIDLSILGRDRGTFDAYDLAIRREYGHLTDGAYRAGRRRVLESLLARPALYRTEALRARFEEAARGNLREALGRL